MPIISTIGRRSPKVRLLIWSIYGLLLLGAVTMVYPFLIMVAGSTKSAVDLKEFTPLPQYVRNDAALYRKHVEGLFNESLDAFHITYDRDTSSFERAAPPVEVNGALVEAWWAFVEGADRSLYSSKSGGSCLNHVGTQRATGIPIRGQISHTKSANTIISRILAGMPTRKNSPEENCLLS